MALGSFPKKLGRTVARVIPQCGMVSQAVAFNMFLVFFPSLLLALGLMSRSLTGKNGQDLAARLTAILPPGSWQLISDFVLRRGGNPWIWVIFGWVGTCLAGSQVMKLIMEGIHLIYGEQEKHSFLGRQLRGLLLFSVAIVAWLIAVALSVFGRPLRRWMIVGFGTSPFVRGFWAFALPLLAMLLAMLVLALIYRVALRTATTWRSIFPGAAAGDDSVVGNQSVIWCIRPKNALWPCLRRLGRCIWPYDLDGVFRDDRLSRSRVECGKPGGNVSNCDQTSGTLDVILQELCWMNRLPASEEDQYEYFSHPVG